MGGLLIRLGKWIESRFPAKLTVTAADYNALISQVQRYEVESGLQLDRLATLEASHNATVDRVAHLEASAVHKGAVSDLVSHVRAQKEELTALKANLGWSNMAKNAELVATLNGEAISNE